MEAALRHFAGVLMHGPSERARSLAASGRLDDFVAGLEAVHGATPPPEAEPAGEASTA